MELAPDFFPYFEALAPLLDQDNRLLCISSWNDHGQVPPGCCCKLEFVLITAVPVMCFQSKWATICTRSEVAGFLCGKNVISHVVSLPYLGAQPCIP